MISATKVSPSSSREAIRRSNRFDRPRQLEAQLAGRNLLQPFNVRLFRRQQREPEVTLASERLAGGQGAGEAVDLDPRAVRARRQLQALDAEAVARAQAGDFGVESRSMGSQVAVEVERGTHPAGDRGLGLRSREAGDVDLSHPQSGLAAKERRLRGNVADQLTCDVLIRRRAPLGHDFEMGPENGPGAAGGCGQGTGGDCRSFGEQ